MACDTAARRGLTLAGQSNLQAFVRAGRNVDRNGLLGAHDAATLTILTRVGDDLALAGAPIAQRHVDELAEDRLLHAADLAAALAARALDGLAAGLHAVAGAARARHVLGE